MFRCRAQPTLLKTGNLIIFARCPVKILNGNIYITLAAAFRVPSALYSHSPAHCCTMYIYVYTEAASFLLSPFGRGIYIYTRAGVRIRTIEVASRDSCSSSAVFLFDFSVRAAPSLSSLCLPAPACAFSLARALNRIYVLYARGLRQLEWPCAIGANRNWGNKDWILKFLALVLPLGARSLLARRVIVGRGALSRSMSFHW